VEVRCTLTASAYFVSHIRYEFVEVGHLLVDVDHMGPVALLDLGSSDGTRSTDWVEIGSL
jgi:hypothetical protein